MSLIKRSTLRPNPPASEQEDSIEPEGAQKPKSAQEPESTQELQNATGLEGAGGQIDKQAARQSAGVDSLVGAELGADQKPPAQAVARQSWPHVTVAPAPAAGGEYASTPWRVVVPSGQGKSLGKGNSFWGTLPNTNRWAMRAAMLCLLVMGARAGKEPLANALRPYTPTGKRDLCLDNLRSLDTALRLYAQDYDGRLPPSTVGIDSWVSVLQAQQGRVVTSDQFLCPAGTAPDFPSRSAYALNPILAGRALSAADDPARTLLLADGGSDGGGGGSSNDKQGNNVQGRNAQDHEDPYADGDEGNGWPLTLKPLLPGWNRVARFPSCVVWPTSTSTATVLDRVAFRHRLRSGVLGQNSEYCASVLYGDGHAAPLVGGAGAEQALNEVQSWGGTLALRSGLERIAARDWLLSDFIHALCQGDEGQAIHCLHLQDAWRRDNPAMRKLLQETAPDLVALWRLNAQMRQAGETSSETMETLGWHLAKAFEGVGDHSVSQSLGRELGRLLEEEHSATTAAGLGEQRALENGPGTFTVKAPANWKKQEEGSGRYRRACWSSSVPTLYLQFEDGQRTSYTPQAPVQWEGMERDMRARYGASYRLVRKGLCSFAGQSASSWEFEFDSPGSPRVRRLYVGYETNWASHVAVFSAPAQDFEKWRPLFLQVLSSFRFA